jgi:uncharacterized Tic20 family protein
MILIRPFAYTPDESEKDKASKSYLMSLVALIAGLPLPIINLVATFFFFVANRKGTYFVRWHCTQALLSQVSMVVLNSIAFWWTISVIFTAEPFTSKYFGYVLTVLVFNIFEFIATIYTAVQARKGVHVEWWLYGALSHLIVKS